MPSFECLRKGNENEFEVLPATDNRLKGFSIWTES
jgi:hypothetical protein